MPPSVAEFVKSAEQSGILTAESLAEFLRGVAADTDATQLANRLVKAGRLTAFQARYVYGGKASSLVLGPYIILDLLGEGGMGVVYKAEHRKMRRVVALKVIARTTLRSPAAVRRFEREVQVAARLEHPNIVTAFDAGEAAGTHYLVMQFVDGRSLAEVVEESGPQPVGRVVDWIIQAARGLAYAHGKGVVHRDIKPDNLLVSHDGTVKILDMGLARLETLTVEQDQLTGTGQVIGTVDYMAPEQAMDTRQADARSDIYSLGVTLWYLLAGRPLFEADSVVKKILAHQQKPAPSLADALRAADPRLDAAFQRMVAKQPADRFQSMEQVIAAFDSIPRSDATAGPPNIAFGGGAVLPRSPGAGVMQPATSLRPVAGRQRRTVGDLKPLHLAIGGGVAGSLLLVGLVMVAVSGRRDARPPVREEAAGGGSPRRTASRLDDLARVAVAEPSPAPRFAPPAEPVSTTPQPILASSTPPAPAVAPFDATQARTHQEAWARHLGIAVETTNSLGQAFVIIPPGRFRMGEHDNAVDVTLTMPFLLGQTEVTQGQWKEVMGTEPWKGQPYTIEGTDVAATYVSWHDAVAFHEKLTTQERASGRIGQQQTYRLPTEAEWEFACRAGTVTSFSFGDDENLAGDFAWFGGGTRGVPIPGGNTAGEMYTHAVRLKQPNQFGLFDVHGNAWEWVADWLADYEKVAAVDPRGPASGQVRVGRGGCWYYPAFICRAAYRNPLQPWKRYDAVGFRLALSPPEAKPQGATRE